MVRAMMRGIDFGSFDPLRAFSIDFVASPKDFAPGLLAIEHQTRGCAMSDRLPLSSTSRP
jgi:hypothetical protein